MEITPQTENGLVFYFGPMSYTPKLGIQDFMALEIQKGCAVLFVDYGTGTVRLEQTKIKLTDGKSHRIDVYWTKSVSDFFFIYIYFFQFIMFSTISLMTDEIFRR